MPDLVFTIKTPAELAGAEDTLQALEQIIGRAKETGKEFGVIEERANRVRSAIEAFKAAQASPPAAATVADDSARYQAALKGMADRDEEAARDQRLEGLRQEIAWRRQLAQEADAQIAAENATKNATAGATDALNESARAADKAA